MVVSTSPRAREALVPVERLRDGRDIAAVLRGRRSRAGRLVGVHVRSAEAAEAAEGAGTAPPRVAVVASRKVGNAVSRNRAKRLLREAAVRIAWVPGTDVVLVARGGCAASTMPLVLAELDELAQRLDAVSPT